MVNSFYRSKKYLIPTTIPYIYMKQIKAQTEHGSHIRAGATHSSVSSFDKFQNLLHILMCVCGGDSPFCRCFANDASLQSLSPLYSYVQCSDELHSSVRLIQTFTMRAHYNTSNESNSPCDPRDPNVRRKFHSHSFFPLTSTLWNRLPPG